MDNMDFENTLTLCDPNNSDSYDSGCIQQNTSFEDPILTIANESEAYFDWSIMGERQDPYAIPMTIVYMIIFLTGIIGNVCTCIVISKNRYMHTATNYYLFSLAVSDLLLLILGLPQDINHLWSKYPYLFGEAFCILRGWSSEASTNASILTITAFTVERYLAICHPLKAHTMSRLSRAIKFIIAIWICSAFAAITMGYQLGIIYEQDNLGNDILETATCSVKRPLDHSFEWFTALFFFVPGTILCILYSLIGLQLKRSSEMGRSHQSRPVSSNVNGSSKMQGMILNSQGRTVSRKSSSASRKDVIKMLVAVVIAFFICWAPFHAQRLMAVYITEPTESDFIIYSYLTNISGVCYYVSATINPILYSILSLKFRHAFRDTLSRCLGRGSALRRRDRHRTMSFFNSTLKSGMEMTEDFTIVSEVPGHEHSHVNHNGGHSTGRKQTRLSMVKNMDLMAGNFSSNSPPRKKTSSTISNASLQMMEAFDDSNISEYIDQMKETQT
ncbi:Pyrokinin-1 receptor like protein [Argiope bruennichi]|uniref:Pyrokinin-1 receptor like protein n=2 Tax=Argiope bruennichi TaxID=94029 RepID=A0A8T0EWV5_ARGBR|nr:Pyrokinin-1 receptor like protein [Argiope bruennichi]